MHISVVVLNQNEGEYLRRTVERLEETLPPASEIIVVDDGSEDGSADFLAGGGGRARLLRSHGLGVALGRNFGARHAGGELLVFSDAHIETPDGWWEPLAEVVRREAVGAAGPALVDMTDPDCRGYGMRFTGPDLGVEWLDTQDAADYPVPLLAGGFWAMRRSVFEAAGGFDEGMIRWGSEDLEFSLRLWLMGYELRLAPEVEVAHLFRERAEYPPESAWVLHNQLRMARVHFSEARFRRVLGARLGEPAFAEAVRLLEEGGAEARRDWMAGRRVREDEWFFQRFGELG